MFGDGTLNPFTATLSSIPPTMGGVTGVFQDKAAHMGAKVGTVIESAYEISKFIAQFNKQRQHTYNINHFVQQPPEQPTETIPFTIQWMRRTMHDVDGQFRTDANPGDLQAMMSPEQRQFMKEILGKHRELYTSFSNDERGHLYGFIARMLMLDESRTREYFAPLLLPQTSVANIEATRARLIEIVNRWYYPRQEEFWTNMIQSGLIVMSKILTPKPLPTPKPTPKLILLSLFLSS